MNVIVGLKAACLAMIIRICIICHLYCHIVMISGQRIFLRIDVRGVEGCIELDKNQIKEMES